MDIVLRHSKLIFFIFAHLCVVISVLRAQDYSTEYTLRVTVEYPKHSESTIFPGSSFTMTLASDDPVTSNLLATSDTVLFENVDNRYIPHYNLEYENDSLRIVFTIPDDSNAIDSYTFILTDGEHRIDDKLLNFIVEAKEPTIKSEVANRTIEINTDPTMRFIGENLSSINNVSLVVPGCTISNLRWESSNHELTLRCLITGEPSQYTNVLCTLNYRYKFWDKQKEIFYYKPVEQDFLLNIDTQPMKQVRIAFVDATQSNSVLLLSDIIASAYQMQCTIYLPKDEKPRNRVLFMHSDALEYSPMKVAFNGSITVSTIFNWNKNIKVGSANFTFSEDEGNSRTVYTGRAEIQSAPEIKRFGVNDLSNLKLDPFANNTILYIDGTNLNRITDYYFQNPELRAAFTLDINHNASTANKVEITVTTNSDHITDNIINMTQMQIAYKVGSKEYHLVQKIDIENKPRPYPLENMIYVKRDTTRIDYNTVNHLNYQYSDDDPISVFTSKYVPLKYGKQSVIGTIKIYDESGRLVQESYPLFPNKQTTKTIRASSDNVHGYNATNLNQQFTIAHDFAKEFIKPGYKIEIVLSHNEQHYSQDTEEKFQDKTFTIYVQREWYDKLHFGLTIPPIIFSISDSDPALNAHPLQAGLYLNFRDIDKNGLQDFWSAGLIIATLNIAGQEESQPNYVGTISENDPPILNVNPINNSSNKGMAGKGDFAIMGYFGIHFTRNENANRFPLLIGGGFKPRSKTHLHSWFAFGGLGVHF